MKRRQARKKLVGPAQGPGRLYTVAETPAASRAKKEKKHKKPTKKPKKPVKRKPRIRPAAMAADSTVKPKRRNGGNEMKKAKRRGPKGQTVNVGKPLVSGKAARATGKNYSRAPNKPLAPNKAGNVTTKWRSEGGVEGPIFAQGGRQEVVVGRPGVDITRVTGTNVRVRTKRNKNLKKSVIV